jgi:HdeA/HdeB family
MSHRIVTSAALAAALCALGLAAPRAAQAKDAKIDQITCEDFLAMDPDNQNRIAYWIDGYAQAKGEATVGTVAFDKFGQPIGALVDDCKATPKATLWEKLKKHL